MIPTLELGPLEFPSYFTLLTVGFMVGIWLAWRHAPALGIEQNRILDVSLIALILGLLGARLLHVIADGHWQTYVNLCLDPMAIEGKKLPVGGWGCPTDYVCQAFDAGETCNVDTGLCHPARDCLRTVKIWYGGLAYYGGFLAAFIGCMWYIVRHKMPVWKVADLCTLGISIGLVFGRVGCFLAGCCFGQVTHSPLGVAFPKGSPAWRLHSEGLKSASDSAHYLFPDNSWWNDLTRQASSCLHDHSLSVHPTQLYHVIANLGVFVVLYVLFRRRRTYDGKILWWFMLLYGVVRSAIEYLRNDNRGVWFDGLFSTSQLISLPLIGVALFMMWRGHRSLKHKPAAE